MKKFRIEFGGILEIMADNEEDAMEKAAKQCTNSQMNVTGFHMCEDQDEDQNRE